MSSNAAIDQDALYYLYVNNEWAGPYQVAQIRELATSGQLRSEDTYAYAAAQQRHYTVEELLAASPTTPKPAAPAAELGNGSSITQGMPALFDDIVDIAPQSSASFDNVLPDLKTLYHAYLGLTEHTADPQQALKDLRGAHQGLIQDLDRRRGDAGALSRIINEIDEVGDYLANRHQLTQLWQLLSEMEKVDLKTHVEDGVSSARAVLASLVGRAETVATAGSDNDNKNSVLLDLDGLEEEADSVVTRKILLSARSEVANTKRDMDVLQQTYQELQEQHAKDLEKARKLLEKAEAARAEERHLARQTAAEVRNLAAEIHRLASEPDIASGANQDLASDILRLGEELKTAEASTLAYMAEDVLIRMIAELRQLASTGTSGDTGPLRAELARARDGLTLAQAQVAQLTSERDALTLQHEQSRIAAQKASELAKDREHRLRSTVTALEVTKELHLEVMADLKSQLQAAQNRVEQTERDLASVRGEMKDSSDSVEARGRAIQHEMQRMVEMKAMLEVRSNELSESLKTAEDELAKAQSSHTQEDNTLAEALAAKVTQLRQTYETTTTRLKDQEANAERLAQELQASRREAEELRGRGDLLSSELGEARGSLSAAKRRLDELGQAYACLEAEREALQNELHHRKNTDTVREHPANREHESERINRLEREGSMLQRQLTAERRQVELLAESRQVVENRLAELASEREDLRRRLEALQTEHFNDHARHTAALAVSTQAAIESERRLNDLQAKISELESRLAGARSTVSDGDSLEPSTARIAGQSHALESTEKQNLRSELEQVARERDQVLEQLETIRTTARSSEASETVAKRLVTLERELTAAKSEIAKLDERQAQAIAERDRLRREAERLKGEREAAAMEHRTALKSARDRLGESQERVAELERQLQQQASDDTSGQALRGHLDQSLVEQERLSREVQRLASELARLNAAVPADRDQQLISLAKASQSLAAEQEKVLVLTRSLMETLQQADSARGRTLELQSQLDQRTRERDQLQSQLERQRAALTDVGLGLTGGKTLSADLEEPLAKRDRAIDDLDQLRKELADTRTRLTDNQRLDSQLQSLDQDLARIRELERELAALRAESDQRQQMFHEARARLLQVSAERDRLAAELADLKSQPDQGAELKMLRRRLVRAKRQIKLLRRQRDEAIAAREKSAANLYELTGQIERLKNAQRAAAEALGLPVSTIPGDLPPVAAPAPTQASAAAAAFTREFHPADLSGGRVSVAAPRAMPTPSDGLVSAFGRPRVLGKAASNTDNQSPNYGNVPVFTSRHGSPSVGQTSHPALMTAKSVRPSRHSHRLLVASLIAGTALAGYAFFGVALPAMFPISDTAVINSTVSITRAPIEGLVSGLGAKPGEAITDGQKLASLRNDRLNLRQLETLREEAVSARGTIAALVKDIEGAQGEQALLLAAQSTWRNERMRAFKALLDANRLTERDARAAVDETDARLHGLRLAGVQTAELVEPAIAYERAKRQLAAASASITELDAALTETAEGKRDAEWERHSELAQIASRLKEATSAHEQAETLLAETEQAITTENARIERLRAAEISATKGGRLLRLHTADGRWLRSGDLIAAVADPTSIVIDCAVSDRSAEDIVLGSEITAYLITDRTEARGRVIAKFSPGHTPIEGGDWAEDFVAKHRFRTVVRIGLEGVPLDTLQIGQGVKVMFLGSSNPGGFTRMLAELAQLGRF